MFPTSEMLDGIGRELEKMKIRDALVAAHPEWEDWIDDSRPGPLLVVSDPRGINVAIGKAQAPGSHIVRWMVVAYDGEFHREPVGMDAFVAAVEEALALQP
ncbi:hypothetical protein JSY14_08010 [Brachybacterium sp. EF45031]|uniref:hypothetical protein n=1 Tax=Brachybacterium sillae TaxID=2810536 RepID=UPI00217E7832|nr:hypothetical protein [Brachybacterium sillae]MCS6711965.1 hypothetical protein [Brachybacterium sillae]